MKNSIILLNSIPFWDYVELFFKKNKVKLLENYPGLNFDYLKNIMSSYLNVSTEDIFIPNDQEKIINFFSDLNEGIPIAYIVGKRFFYKSEFLINKYVLIPRVETELLVELACKKIDLLTKNTNELSIIDVGTGSGAIILSILQEIDHSIMAMATDIAKEALNVAMKNFFHLRYRINRDSSLCFRQCDRLTKIDHAFNLIISNPPYIKKLSDKKTVHKSVKLFEPEIALFLNDDEYDAWYEEFFVQSQLRLVKDGWLLLEGHEEHLDSFKNKLLINGFYNINIINDYSGRKRLIEAQKK